MKVIALVFSLVILGASSTTLAMIHPMDIAGSDMRDALSHRDNLKDFIQQARQKAEQDKAKADTEQQNTCTGQDCQQSLEAHKPLVL